MISLPCLDDYWSIDPILCHSWFCTVMPRNHFHQILRCIHVVNNTNASSCNAPGYDKLWKVRPILNVLDESIPKLYALRQQVLIEESMTGTKCNLSFIQYMLKKINQAGYKGVGVVMHTMVIHNFVVYTGANLSILKYSL